MNSLYEELKNRGYIYQTTNEEKVKEILDGEPRTIYMGIDPTADSLHIGHCFPLIVLRKLQDRGHKVIVLIGGATAMVGDPTGKTDMRKMITQDFINKNLESVKTIIGKFLKTEGDNPVTIVNNHDWFKEFHYIEFMREVAVHFNVNKMLASDACKTRLNEGGLTFFEMGYQLMQAYDFFYLNRNYGCVLQIGGSDQWANILAGADYGRKINNLEGKDEEAFQAMTIPLLTNSEGKKMGKTEKGAVWVLKEKMSPFEFYQYFYNIQDKDVEKMLKLLTNVSLEEIEELIKGDIRIAKQRMAYEITKFVHGEEEADNALKVSLEMYSQDNFDDAPSVQIDKSKVENIKLIDLLCDVQFMASKSEARRMIEQNAVSVNGEKVKDIDKIITLTDFNDGYLLLKRGKKNYLKVELI